MKRILPFLILFICSQADAKIWIKPFDSIGISISSDIRVNCDDNAIWKFDLATGDWACDTDSTGAGANITVKENNTVISSAISTDDYGLGLDATENPTGEINISMDLSEVTSTMGTLPVAGGGTGVTSITDGGVLIGKGTAALANTGVLADGTIIIGDGATNPTTLTAFSSATGTLSAAQFPTLAGDITTPGGSLTTTIAADAVALGTDTTNNYVATIAGGNATLVTGSGSETAAVTVSWDTVTVSQDGLSAVVNSPSGFQTISNRATLLQGCANDQILKWNETNDIWACATDSGGSEVNNLETITTGILTTEIPIGTAADTAVYSALSGDVTMNNSGVVTIAANSVALTTDTTGNYAAGDAEAGAALTGDSATSFFSAGTIEVARGGTALSSVSDDAVLIGNSAASGYDQPALPSCSNATTSKLLWNNTTNNWSCGTDQDTGGSSGWTDGGTLVRVTTSTDNVLVGGANLDYGANLQSVGTADEIQLLVRGFSTQTTKPFTVENSASTDVFTVSDDGSIVAASTGTFGGTNQSTITEGLVVNNGATGDADDDFQVKGDTDNNTLYVKVSSDRVGIGIANPTQKLDVIGSIKISNDILGTATTNIGWTVVDGTDNTAGNDQCLSACIFGIQNATGSAVTTLVSCNDATADLALCAGAS